MTTRDDTTTMRATKPMRPAVNNIRALRMARAWTQKTLSERAAVDLGDISKMETGYRGKQGRPETLQRIADALGVSIEDLGVTRPQGLVAAKPPMYEVEVRTQLRAGPDDEAIEYLHDGFGREYLSEEPRDGMHAIELYGDSLEPEFFSGDRLVVKPCDGDWSTIRDGEVVVAEHYPDDDQPDYRRTTVKVFRRENGHRYLVPLNPRYEPRLITKRWRCAGIVMKHIRYSLWKKYAGCPIGHDE